MMNLATHPVSLPQTQHDKLVKQAQKWVAMTFYGTLLKETRNDPFRSKLFDGGRGGEAFGEMYDQELAERIGGGPTDKLVNAIVKRIERGRTQGSYDRQLKLGTEAGKLSGERLQPHVATDIRA